MIEHFKDIEGYEGLYQISNLGRVKSLPKGDGNGYKERFLKFESSKKNATGQSWLRVSLSVNGKVKRQSVHRLVANAFISKVEGKDIINHIDGNPSNNHASNLEWCNLQENAQHAYNTGLSTHTPLHASLCARDKNHSMLNDRFSKLLGHNFLGLTHRVKVVPSENNRGYDQSFIMWNCPTCGKYLETRPDSLTFKRENPNCRSCHVKKKI